MPRAKKTSKTKKKPKPRKVSTRKKIAKRVQKKKVVRRAKKKAPKSSTKRRKTPKKNPPKKKKAKKGRTLIIDTGKKVNNETNAVSVSNSNTDWREIVKTKLASKSLTEFNNNDVDSAGELLEFKERVEKMEEEHKKFESALLDIDEVLANSLKEFLEGELKVKDLSNELKSLKGNRNMQTENNKNKYTLLMNEAQELKHKLKDELDIERERRLDLEKKVETYRSRSSVNESELKDKVEKLQQVEMEIEDLKNLVAANHRDREKSLQEFGEKTKESEASLRACIAEIKKCIANKTNFQAKEKTLQVKLNQLKKTTESTEAQLARMGEALAEQEGKLEVKENLFAGQTQTIKEQLDAVLNQASTYQNQLEVAKGKISSVEKLSSQIEELNRKLAESSNSAEKSLQREKDAIGALKIQKEAKVVLEARRIAIEAQLKQQSKEADLGKTKWEQTRDSLKEKLKTLVIQSSAKDSELCEMKKTLKEKSLKVGLMLKHVASLDQNLNVTRVSVNNLSEKTEQVERALNLKAEEITSISQKSKEELNRHEEQEKLLGANIMTLQTELHKISNSKDLAEVQLQEKSNALNKARKQIDELNDKAKTLEYENTELARRRAEFEAAVEKQAEQILEKETAVESIKARVTVLSEINHELSQKISVQKLAFESKVAELDSRLSTMIREQERKDSDDRRMKLEVLYKTEKNLLEVNAEIKTLNIKLKDVKADRKVEENDHQAEVDGYEEAIKEKNKIIRDLTEELETLKPERMSQPGTGKLLGVDQTTLPKSG